jgi:ribosomal protein L37AE/L43A
MILSIKIVLSLFGACIIAKNIYENVNINYIDITDISNKCNTFTVSIETSCIWMCHYCSTILNTTNYYFTDANDVPLDEYCNGMSVEGRTYTCCRI